MALIAAQYSLFYHVTDQLIHSTFFCHVSEGFLLNWKLLFAIR